jgi:phosphatidylserine/phosphatidylglycerophosphate/cardiolipin synthase-like enzyme
LNLGFLQIDGIWSTVGSTNLDRDYRSFALNEELNVVLYDTAIAGRLEAVFDHDARPLQTGDIRGLGGRPRDGDPSRHLLQHRRNLPDGESPFLHGTSSWPAGRIVPRNSRTPRMRARS